MRSDGDLAAMTDACIEAARHVERSGSPELQAAMRVLLCILARETIEAARPIEPDDA